jgi:hypothetical protein
VLSLRTFEKAVRRYRRRTLSVNAVPSLAYSTTGLSGIGPYAPSLAGSEPDAAVAEDTASVQSRSAREQLEALPTEILDQARALEERVKYFAAVGQRAEDGEEHPELPASLQRLMDEIAHAEGVSDRVRREVFQDEQARRVRPFSQRGRVAVD